MSAVLATGAVVGLGLFLLIYALVPRRASLARQLAAFDAARPPMSQAMRRVVHEQESEFSRRMGRALAAFCAEQGWEFPSLRANLSLIGKSFENYLATKVLLAFLGFLTGPLFLLAASAAGFHVPFILPVWFGLLIGGTVAVFALWRRPKDLSDVLCAGALLSTVALLLAKWAFLNYYFVPVWLLVLALAGRVIPLDGSPTRRTA